MPGAAIVMRDRTTCDMPLTAAYCHNKAIFPIVDKQTSKYCKCTKHKTT